MTDDKLVSYGRTLRRRQWHALGLIALGLLGMVVSTTLLPGSDLPFHARTFYQGAGCGLLFAGAANLIRTSRLLKRPEQWKESRVRETDERQRYINRGAAHFAGAAVMYLQFAAALVLVTVDWRLGLLMTGFVMAYFALYWAAYRWLAGKV